MIHSVYKLREEWFVKWAIKQNVKCIYDNPEYIEFYNPNDEIK